MTEQLSRPHRRSPAAETLARALGMFGSDHDGEVLVAARMG